MGFAGASQSFHLGKYFRLHPGAGVLFGKEEPTGAALKLRCFFETEHLVGECSVIQALRSSAENHRDQFTEGHFSWRMPAWQHRKMEFGLALEHIARREEIKENLLGFRFMVPIGSHLGFTAKVMSHNTYRVGMVWLPSHHKEKH